MISFAYEKRFGGLEILRIETMFEKAVSPGWTGSLYDAMKAQGLGYRKTVLLEDFRHYAATRQAKTPEALERAETWYQRVYKPLQEESKFTAAKMTELLTKIREGSIETEAEAEAQGKYADKYEQYFD
jgi:hypothetical protein